MVSSVAISNSEYTEAYITGTVLVLVATFFLSVRTWTSWADLMRWSPTQALLCLLRKINCWFKKEDGELWTPREDLDHDSSSSSDSYDDVSESLLEKGKVVNYAQTVTPCSSVKAVFGDELSRSSLVNDTCEQTTLWERVVLWFQSVDWLRLVVEILVALIAQVFLPVAILAFSQASSPLIANVALDTTVNELSVEGDGDWIRAIDRRWHHRESLRVHPSNRKLLKYSLSADNSLYRQTTGFKGDLAFNVSVNDTNPSNVVVVTVESVQPFQRLEWHSCAQL